MGNENPWHQHKAVEASPVTWLRRKKNKRKKLVQHQISAAGHLRALQMSVALPLPAQVLHSAAKRTYISRSENVARAVVK